MAARSPQLKLLFAALLMLPGRAQQAGGQTVSDSAIQAILQDRVNTKRTVGLVVGVLDHGKQKLYTV